MTVRDHFKRPCLEEDRFDIIGKSVAIKLRGVAKRQSLIAEKIINDVIFEAELGNLTLEHKCINTHEITQQMNHSMQQHRPPAMFSRHYISSPLYSSTPSPITTPTPTGSPNFMQYTQSEEIQLQQHTSHYQDRNVLSQQFPHTKPAQHYSQSQENQQTSANALVLDSTGAQDSAASFISSFTEI